jgi:prepilin-type N-terminal cleavage/methylation domain-containing protein/prepilin-type processing-associated H-X9-DG protein
MSTRTFVKIGNNQKRGGLKAFTLTELLVVVLVLSLVLSIAVPIFSRVVTYSNRVRCASNLHHIAAAYNSRKADENLRRRLPFEAKSWARALKYYLGKNRESLVCPEDDDLGSALPDVKITVRWGSTFYYNLDTFTAYPYWEEYSGADCPGGGAGIWKLSESQYQSVEPFIAESYNLTNHLPMYDPGPDPKHYYLLFEDQRSGEEMFATGDKDYEDIILEVHETGRGDIEFTAKRGYSVFSFDLIGPDGTTYTNVGTGDGTGPFEFDGVGYLSYGMNWRADDFPPQIRKILVLDYEEQVADVGGIGTDAWDQLRAPRHFNKCNVLFADGSVELFSPDEIDPIYPENDAKYWDPLE